MAHAIDNAASAAYRNHKINKISMINLISDKEKEAFLKKNCFKCKAFDIKITKFACITYQRMAITAKTYEPTHKCLGCKRFNKKMIGKLEKKKCLLEVEFPGYCSGTKVFIRPVKMSFAAWNNKVCCSSKCTLTLSNFKTAGYKNINDVSERRRESSMVVDLRV